MKKLLLSICIPVCLSYSGYSQCSTSSAPTSNCNYGINISAFSLAGVASVGNSGCSSNGYGNFTTPVRTLTLGIAYPWTASTGGNYNPMGVAIWIDLNNDGFYSASEMVASDASSLSHSGTLTVPMSATPGTGRSMRVRAAAYQTPQPGDACNYVSYFMETEDYKVDLMTPPPCTNTPTNSVITPTYQICPNGTTSIGLATTFTNYGYHYQWQYSNTSAVGPWTTIPTATLPTYATPNMTASTYYSVIMTCTNITGSVTASAGQVTVASTIVKNVPYLEDFEGINYNNQLPNCSWLATNSPSVTQTYTSTQSQNRIARSGSKFGAFYTYYINGTSYFFTNGLNLQAGITYSASVWYTTDFNGYTNVTNMSLLYGTTQTTTGLVNIASASPVSSGIYKALGNTFTVPTSGVYYIAIGATSNGNYGTNYLSWDDLKIEIPCSLNSTTVTLSASQTTICSGDQVNLTVSGADTYTWNTGSHASAVTDSPLASFLYSVTGTSTLTGCTDTQYQMITVNQSPNLVVFSDKPISCAGSPVHLSVYGADTYTWNNPNSNLANITVSPTITTTYQVLGTNSVNCQAHASQQVSVVPLPVVTAASSQPNTMCTGETQTLTGSGTGVVSFQWASNTLFIQSQTAYISPMVTTVYTLTGTDANGCQGKTTITQSVDACTGLAKIQAASSGVRVYPNPSAGLITVEMSSADNKLIEVTDITGRIVYTTTTKEGKVDVNLGALSNGIYYVKVQSENASDVIKVVKQ